MVLVTCAITTHKRKPEIVERALKSILNQTYKNIEIFVVDDSPSDWEFRNDVKDMVESYESQNVKYIPHEKCMGACVARNTALENSGGEYIGFLDDDDEWKPTKVEKLLAGFVNENVALVYCNREKFFDSRGEGELENPKIFTGMVFDKLILDNFIGSTSFPILKTSCLKEIGGFDPLMQSAQDYDVWLRLAEKYEVQYIDEALIIYHVHEGDQITKNPMKRINGLERLSEKNKEYLAKNNEACWYKIVEILRHYIDTKMYARAISGWLKAVSKQPFKIKGNLYYLYYMCARFVVNHRRK